MATRAEKAQRSEALQQEKKEREERLLQNGSISHAEMGLAMTAMDRAPYVPKCAWESSDEA